MNTFNLIIYYSTITLLFTTSVEGKYLCNLESLPPTCHQHSQAIGLSSVRPERRLLFTFDVNTVASKFGIVGGHSLGRKLEGRYGVLAPDSNYLTAYHVVFLHALMIGSAFAVIIYHVMISKKRQAMTKKMVVAGILISLYIILPCIYFDAMNVQNPAVRQTFVLCFVIFILRTLEGKSYRYAEFWTNFTPNCFLT